MGLDSLSYYVFLYWLACLFWFWRPSPGLLLGASLLFYGTFEARHLLLLAALMGISHAGAIRLTSLQGKRRTLTLVMLLAAIFAPLLLYKLADAASAGLLFPLGLSFFTFHGASYLIDAYRGFEYERAWSRVALYIAFFPQVMAGPITRPAEMLPQLRHLARPTPGMVERAVWRIYLGLFKKLTIANGAYAVWREIDARPEGYRGATVLAAVLLGRYYVYADFSGYCDIAIGSAALFGIKLPENFQRPFAATSIAEYWRRWHITLNTWIRDYIFFPLAGSPAGRLGPYPLVLLTFALLGLWHGFRWNFLFYGLWHGALVILYDVTRAHLKFLHRVPASLRAWATFLFLVCPPTIFFLTRTPAEAAAIARALGNGTGTLLPLSLAWGQLCLLGASILLLETFHWCRERAGCIAWLRGRPLAVRALAAIVAFAWLALTTYQAADSGFLYFQF